MGGAWVLCRCVGVGDALVGSVGGDGVVWVVGRQMKACVVCVCGVCMGGCTSVSSK
jgi:hypothetical protein